MDIPQSNTIMYQKLLAIKSYRAVDKRPIGIRNIDHYHLFSVAELDSALDDRVVVSHVVSASCRRRVGVVSSPLRHIARSRHLSTFTSLAQFSVHTNHCLLPETKMKCILGQPRLRFRTQ